MFNRKSDYPQKFDDFAKQNNLTFPPAKRNTYTSTLKKFVKCVKATNKKCWGTECGDLSHYFDVLTHLKMKEGCRLEYITYGDSCWGARPLIDFSNIVIDKSPEGAWEAVLLINLGGQFNLQRHAGYSQCCIAGSWQDFYRGWPADEVSGRQVCAETDMKTLSTWDISPKVEMNDDETATVYYCIFNAWDGFRQVSQCVHFDTGELDEPVLLEYLSYCCRVMF